MKCCDCNAEIPDDSKICPKCGEKITLWECDDGSESFWECDAKSLKDVMTVFRAIQGPRIFAGQAFNLKKLDNAIKSYAQELADDGKLHVLLHIDDTLFGGAKDGLIVTRDAVYSKERGGSPRKIEITSGMTFEIFHGYPLNSLFVAKESFWDFRRQQFSAMEKVAEGLSLLAAKK